MTECYYGLLEVGQTATLDEIKRAYRAKALKFHPDKNPENCRQATEHFTLIQRAFEVLSDPGERSWYDSHRESILDPQRGTGVGLVPDLMAYFSSSAYEGMDDSAGGFYSVYGRAFERIAEFEKRFFDFGAFSKEEAEVHLERLGIPFGTRDTPYDPEVRRFYAGWGSFVPMASFAFCDEFSPRRPAENRATRRMLEKELRKRRDEERRKFSETVRNLVEFVKRRDLRFLQRKQQKEPESPARREAKKSAGHARPSDLQCFDEEYGASLDDLMNDFEELFCFACNVGFGSEAALAEHGTTPTHEINALELRAELLEEEQQFLEKKERARKGKPAKAVEPAAERKPAEQAPAKTKREKRREREAKKGDNLLRCGACGQGFSSRNKLFLHVRELQHAVGT